ncbi:hypothetical protein [Reichenbachiella sp. MALMAid0571]|uniref:hypothetical protein n=1 Tax=Reichenbachiella sp. MALMAid0571 TaxID=3143939 RepID=UPI0032DFB47E
MKSAFFILITIFTYSGTLMAQGVSDTPKANPDLGESKYNHLLHPKSYTSPKDLRLPLSSKGLINKSIGNIGLYGKQRRDSLLAAQPQAKLKIEKSFEPIVYSSNMPVKRIKDKIYMPTVQPADSSVYHSLLRKRIK